MSNIVIVTNDQTTVINPTIAPPIVVNPSPVNPIIVSAVGTQGLKGDRGDSSLIKHNFAFGDATPTPIATLIGRLASIRIVIDEPFNGANPAIFIGDSLVSDRYFQANQIDPKVSLTYGNYKTFLFTVSTEILLTIIPGASATTGKGQIILEV